jgi:hypothetical protein
MKGCRGSPRSLPASKVNSALVTEKKISVMIFGKTLLGSSC